MKGLCAVFAAACLVAPVVTYAQSPPTEIDPNTVAGTIAIHGCQVAADDLLVRARPLSFPPSPVAPDAVPPSPVAPGTVPPSPIAPGALPPNPIRPATGTIVVKARSIEVGKFGFLIPGLTPGIPYRLAVKLLGNSRTSCEKMAWDVPSDPLVMAGTFGVSIDGYAVRSRLDVWGDAVGSRTERAWVSADALDFDDPVAAVRTFRWRSLDGDVTGGQLQVSTRPFPRGGARPYAGPCSADDSQLVFKRDFSVTPGEYATVSVDFNAIVYGTNRSDAVDPGAAVLGNLGMVAGRTGGLSEEMLTRVNLGHPLYVRVMPTRDGSVLCDPNRGVPAESTLAKWVAQVAQLVDDPQISISKAYYTPPYIGARPQAGETCYRVTQKHTLTFPLPWDSLANWHLKGVFFGQDALEGMSFCVPNESDDDGWFESFVDGFSDVLTGLVDEIGSLVNSASDMWEKIKDYAVDAAAAGINVMGFPCDADCEKALRMGLEVAMATMGAPPSLPNFDQLMDQGIDYLAAQAASQAGIPPELSDYASDKAQEVIKKAAANMKDRPYGIPKLPDWLVPYLRFDPAYLTLELHGTGLLLPSRPGIIRANDPIFAGRFVQLPRRLPTADQKPLVFPMVLEPNTWGLPPAPSNYSEYDAGKWDKDHWAAQRFENGCYHLFLVGLWPVGDHLGVLWDGFFNPKDTSPCQPK